MEIRALAPTMKEDAGIWIQEGEAGIPIAKADQKILNQA